MVKGKDLAATTPLYKALKPDLLHRNNFQWRLGWNESPTGLYFGRLSDVIYFMKCDTLALLHDQLLGAVSLDDDEDIEHKVLGYRAKRVWLANVMRVQDAPPDLYNQILDEAVRVAPTCICSFPESLLTQKRVDLAYSKRLSVAKSLGVKWRPSEQQMLAAVQRDGLQLQLIERPSERVCLEAVRQNPESIKHANPKLLQNREFWYKAIVASNGRVYCYLSCLSKNYRLMADQALASRAIRYDPTNIKYIPPIYLTSRLLRMAYNNNQISNEREHVGRVEKIVSC